MHRRVNPNTSCQYTLTPLSVLIIHPSSILTPPQHEHTLFI